MKQLPSFLQDTKHTIQIIEEINAKIDLEKGSVEGVALVTLDVESMYNFMSEELAVGACKEFLQGRREGDPENMKIKTESILKALDLCLKSNFFEFNDKIYQQTGGVGTGIKLAPTYACLGMGKYESIAFNTDFELLDRILLWKRFIDDVLMLFEGSKEECEKLVDRLNSLRPGVVKFKFEYSTEMVEFLDLKIFFENERLETDLYIKPSNLQLYLYFLSNHPEPCKQGVVYGQALRIIERCSKIEDRDHHLENLKTKLLDRNYPDKLIKEKFAQAKKKTRKEIINQNRKKGKGEDKKVRLIFTHMWLREAKKCLVKNEKAKEMGGNIQICYSQPKNLKRIVTQKKVTKMHDEQPGCFKCGRCRVSCPILKEGGQFTSSNTHRTYPIRQRLDCDCSFVAYLATFQIYRG